MSDKPYSNREIDSHIYDIRNSLQRIEVQTTTTNGRVTKLEKWQGYVLGFCAALTMLFVPILFLFLKYALGA